MRTVEAKNTSRIRVAVNGYGVIGKRVADAVRVQPDMDLVGVGDVSTDYRVRAAVILGLPLYAAQPDRAHDMEAAGIPVAGALEDLLAQAEVVVDCTPKGVGAMNLERYRTAGVKAVLQGGEKHSATGHCFVAQANYESALGRDATRVVSCNTTATVRTLFALDSAGLLRKARGVLVRRATDPWESHLGGIMNTVVPEPRIPSHQTVDAQRIMPHLDVVTLAAKAAHTQTHNHYWVAELRRKASRQQVLEAFRAAPRVALIRMSDGIEGLNSTIELMKDLGRPRGDMWEVAVWEDVLKVQGREVFYTYQVYNEAVVVPENVDAVRALAGTVTVGHESIRITDASLGIRSQFLAP